MKITGRITLDKHMTLDQLESLDDSVRGVAYPRLEMNNGVMYFEIETDDFAPGNNHAQDLSVVTARALYEEAQDLGIKFEEAARLVHKAVAVTAVWDEIVDIAATYGCLQVEVVE